MPRFAEIQRLLSGVVGIFQQIELAVEKPKTVWRRVWKESAERSDRPIVADLVGNRLMHSENGVNRLRWQIKGTAMIGRSLINGPIGGMPTGTSEPRPKPPIRFPAAGGSTDSGGGGSSANAVDG